MNRGTHSETGPRPEDRPVAGGRGRRRGRALPLAALSGGILLATVMMAAAGRLDPAPSDPQQALPAVAAGPAGPAGPAAVETPAVPAEVLARVPTGREILEPAGAQFSASGRHLDPGEALAESVAVSPTYADVASPVRVEYTFDPDLERRVFDILAAGDVRLGNVVVMDPESGRVLAYASTDVDRFPPTRTYPAASLIKVVTAAAALHHSRAQAEAPCRYLGSPYVLTPARLDPPRKGIEVSLERALAMSNNQCFAQLAVHALGTDAMVDAIRRFGFLAPPAPGHAAGMIDAGTDRFDLGRLGCGLTGTWITPLHAAMMASTLARGRQVEPYWIERVTDATGRRLRLGARRPPRQVLTPALADELRGMLVETTLTGTARRGFRAADGGPILGPLQAAGKTGSLSGTDPAGHYEWFAGVAPAEDPKVAIAVVVVQQQRYRMHASQVAGRVLQAVFCPDGACRAEAAARWLHDADSRVEGATQLAAEPTLPNVDAAPPPPGVAFASSAAAAAPIAEPAPVPPAAAAKTSASARRPTAASHVRAKTPAKAPAKARTTRTAKAASKRTVRPYDLLYETPAGKAAPASTGKPATAGSATPAKTATSATAAKSAAARKRASARRTANASRVRVASDPR